MFRRQDDRAGVLIDLRGSLRRDRGVVVDNIVGWRAGNPGDGRTGDVSALAPGHPASRYRATIHRASPDHHITVRRITVHRAYAVRVGDRNSE